MRTLCPPAAATSRPASLALTSDLGEIDRVPRALARARRLGRGRPPRAAQEPDHLPERPRADDLEIVHEGGLGRVRRRDDHASQSRARGGDRHRQHARCRDQPAPERQLAGEHPPFEPLRGHLRGGREHPHRDRQVEARAFLAERPRREVHDDAAQRPLQPSALDRRPDPVAGVLDPRAGQPGDRERREPATDVRLDGDEVAPDADDGDAVDASVHGWPTLAATTDT